MCVGAMLFLFCLLNYIAVVHSDSSPGQPAFWLSEASAQASEDAPVLNGESLAVLTDVEPLTIVLHMPLLYSPTLPVTLFLPIVSDSEPYPLLNPHPAHAATNQSPNTYLSWMTSVSASDLVSGLVYYDVYLEANNSQPGALVAQGLTEPNFDPPTLSLDTWYYWRVAVTNEQGVRVIGPVWAFHVEPFLYPPAIGTTVLVPAGEFLMGCDLAVEACNEPKERPLHPVYLDTFEIDKYEVTNVEYRACVDANVCPRPRLPSSRKRSDYFYNPTYDYYPVMYVSWWNATTYCEWVDKRLPTEAEWEKAARGPIDTRIWPWGNEMADCSRANFYAKCVGDTEPVGSHPTGASPYGVMDMSGSMFEWVYDRFSVFYYSNSPYENPQGPEFSRPNPNKPSTSHPYFVIRGGSYHDNWWYSRVTHRHWGHHGDRPGHDSPNYRSFRVGIRCARSVTE